MRTTLTIGTRGSQLALTQTNWVAEQLRILEPSMEVAIEVISTKGDRVLDKPLAEIGGKGLFTLELETALRDGSIDLAVHSLKDLPTEDSEGLTVGAIPERETPNDGLVCAKWDSLDALPKGARVGTSSLRRKAQLLHLRPDLNVVDLRGNIDTRMGKVTSGDLDAAILACAGIRRLGFGERIAQVIPESAMLPACGQGALGVQCRDDDVALLAILSRLTNAATRAEVVAERTFLEGLGGGCQTPIAALARVSGTALTMTARVCSLDGAEILTESFEGEAGDAEELGRFASRALLARGADAIIAASTGGQ